MSKLIFVFFLKFLVMKSAASPRVETTKPPSGILTAGSLTLISITLLFLTTSSVKIKFSEEPIEYSPQSLVNKAGLE